MLFHRRWTLPQEGLLVSRAVMRLYALRRSTPSRAKSKIAATSGASVLPILCCSEHTSMTHDQYIIVQNFDAAHD